MREESQNHTNNNKGIQEDLTNTLLGQIPTFEWHLVLELLTSKQ